MQTEPPFASLGTANFVLLRRQELIIENSRQQDKKI
jgi:hypothetical protein